MERKANSYYCYRRCLEPWTRHSKDTPSSGSPLIDDMFILLAGKAAGADKKLYKQIEVKYDPSSLMSPPDDDSIRSIISPFGPMNQPASRRTLFYLIGTLNASFPDYDFS